MKFVELNAFVLIVKIINLMNFNNKKQKKKDAIVKKQNVLKKLFFIFFSTVNANYKEIFAIRIVTVKDAKIHLLMKQKIHYKSKNLNY